MLPDKLSATVEIFILVKKPRIEVLSTKQEMKGSDQNEREYRVSRNKFALYLDISNKRTPCIFLRFLFEQDFPSSLVSWLTRSYFTISGEMGLVVFVVTLKSVSQSRENNIMIDPAILCILLLQYIIEILIIKVAINVKVNFWA